MTSRAGMVYEDGLLIAEPVAGCDPKLAARMNLRDMGGFPAHGGRHVRYGMIYRGGLLHELDDETRAFFEGLGLRYVYDLRSQVESSKRPDTIISGPTYLQGSGMIYHGREVDFSPWYMTRIEQEQKGLVEGQSLWQKLYVGMAFDTPAVHEIVRLVVEGEVPIYIHCTAGKDRTGVVVAILGLMLGVPREELMWDFLLTNDYRRDFIEWFVNTKHKDSSEETRAIWRKNLSVHEPNLQAVFDAIDERYATPEEYLEAEFGLDEATLAAVRDRYLE